MTVRELIAKYQAKLLTSQDMHGDEASQILVELSALVGNVNDEILRATMSYNRFLSGLMDTPNMSAAAATIRAEASEEYEAMLRAKGYLVLVQEMTRALKYRLKSLEAEEQLSRNT